MQGGYPLAEHVNEPTDYVLYARVGIRVKAFLIDYFIVIGALLLLAVVGANVTGTGAAAFGLWVAILLLYDPLTVWWTSGTLGHHLMNLRVVSDRTGRSPSLLAALVRHVVKAVFGVLSFAAMSGSRRHKTLHDWIAGTTVQIRDEQRARLKDYRRVALPRAPQSAG
jgi:uncharacterized RDD family membrane protein YckC